MEELLNKLIEKGWKPYGFIVQNAKKPPYSNRYYFFENCADGRTLRELVSKESGLWQFVCENEMINKENKLIDGIKEKRWTHETSMKSFECLSIFYEDGVYWIIESALKDESELEDFLLENIKIS